MTDFGPSAHDIALSTFLGDIESAAHQFSATLAFIDAWYTFTPSGFRNGAVSNTAQENQGSCRVLALALLEDLSPGQALKCFGEHYRDVLATPDLDNHHNLRRLLAKGLVDIEFDHAPLQRR